MPGVIFFYYISPALLEAIQTAFDVGYGESDFISELLAKVQTGSATYEEANLFAESVEDLLADCYKKCLSSEVLPDGTCENYDREHGLMQTITSTFMNNKIEGHDDIYNAYDNMLAALHYIQRTYPEDFSGIGEGHGY